MKGKIPQLHEEFTREYHGVVASDRRFGFVVGGLLLLFGCVRIFFHRAIAPFSISLCLIGVVLVLGALVKPDLLKPANKAWTALGLMLHRVTNPVFLGAIYLLAIIPTGMMMRAFGADPMGRWRKPRDTYLNARQTSGSTTNSILKPF